MLDPYLSVCVPFTYLDLNQRLLNGCIEDQAFSQSHNLVPPSPSPISKFDSTGDTQKKRPLPDGRGSWRRAKSRDCKKAWSSIKHAILSDLNCPPSHPPPAHLPRSQIVLCWTRYCKSSLELDMCIVHSLTPHKKGVLTLGWSTVQMYATSC